MAQTQRPVRIAGCSGSGVDRRFSIESLAKHHPNDSVDCIIGDWMSEADMTTRGASKHENADEPAFANNFLETLEPGLVDLARHKIKLVVNAGASDTQRLYDMVKQIVSKQDLDLKVAWISGDDVFDAVQRALDEGREQFTNIHTGELLSDWKFTPVAAQAYLGGFGIATALSEGADIVICGRVADASLTIGAAIWWHKWNRGQLDCLANALIAGHLIECSTYVSGGNFSGFRKLEFQGWDNIGFPIAEIGSNGQVVITKQKNTGGEISTNTCTAQLLYEIQGVWYFNSDVTADITRISFMQIGTNRVSLRGVQGLPPPPTTKVGITAKGGFSAEFHWFLVGLDIRAKAAMMEAQTRRLLAPYSDKFTVLNFTMNGTSPDDPANQNAATVDFRVVAQAPTAEDLAPNKFIRPCIDNTMQSYPGGTPHLDVRTGYPRPIYEYFVTLFPQDRIKHTVHINGQSISIRSPSSSETRTYPSRPPTTPASTDAPAIKASGGLTDAAGGWAELPAQKGRSVLRETFGPWGRTTRAPLGWVAHARSGDKGSDCNVGFWVSSEREYEWLRWALSESRIRDLLGEDYSRWYEKISRKTGAERGTPRIERTEFAGLKAVHFLLRDILDRGVSCTSSYDFLGKNMAEYLRSRWIDLPVRFLQQGRL